MTCAVLQVQMICPIDNNCTIPSTKIFWILSCRVSNPGLNNVMMSNRWFELQLHSIRLNKMDTIYFCNLTTLSGVFLEITWDLGTQCTFLQHTDDDEGPFCVALTVSPASHVAPIIHVWSPSLSWLQQQSWRWLQAVNWWACKAPLQ